MKPTAEQLQALADLITRQHKEQWDKDGYTHDLDPARPGCAWVARVKPGRKFTKIDVGSSGKYMVDNETGEIYGIKGYGVVHRGHRYGALETVGQWYWGGYVAFPKPESKPYQPKTGQPCHCKPGQQRDNCPDCEGTGMRIDFAAIRARRS